MKNEAERAEIALWALLAFFVGTLCALSIWGCGLAYQQTYPSQQWWQAQAQQQAIDNQTNQQALDALIYRPRQ